MLSSSEAGGAQLSRHTLKDIIWAAFSVVASRLAGVDRMPEAKYRDARVFAWSKGVTRHSDSLREAC
jgi:hypothetical protein